MGHLACCIYSDRLRFIYVKVPKTGGSSVMFGWLRPALCPLAPGEAPYVSNQPQYGAKYSGNCSTNVLSPGPWNSNPCVRCESIDEWKWRDYFVFSTMRSPWSRLVSQYTYCRVGDPTPWPNVPFSDFCGNTSLADFCTQNISHAYTAKRGRNVHLEVPVHPAYHGEHGWHVDYMVAVEDMAAGLRDVAMAVNARLPESETLRLPAPAVAPRSNSQDVASNTDAAAAEERQRVCEWYAGLNATCRGNLEATGDPWVLCYDWPCG